MAYIADVVYHPNELNLSLQGQQRNVITACEKLNPCCQAELQKITLLVKNFLLQNVKHDIIAHLMMLGNSFDGYFSDGELNAAQQWIMNPFLFDLTTMSDHDNLKEDLIEIKSCQRFQLLFEKSKLRKP